MDERLSENLSGGLVQANEQFEIPTERELLDYKMKLSQTLRASQEGLVLELFLMYFDHLTLIKII